jgi:hypothetical protein
MSTIIAILATLFFGQYATCQDSGVTMVGDYSSYSVQFVINGENVNATFGEYDGQYSSYTYTIPDNTDYVEFSGFRVENVLFGFEQSLIAQDCLDLPPDVSGNYRVFLPIVF